MRPFAQLATVLSGSQHLLEPSGSSQSPPATVDVSKRRWPQRANGQWEPDRTAWHFKRQFRTAGSKATGAHNRLHIPPRASLVRCQDRPAVVRVDSSHRDGLAAVTDAQTACHVRAMTKGEPGS